MKLRSDQLRAVEIAYLIKYHRQRWNEINQANKQGLPLWKAIRLECVPYRDSIEYKTILRQYSEYLAKTRAKRSAW